MIFVVLPRKVMDLTVVLGFDTSSLRCRNAQPCCSFCRILGIPSYLPEIKTTNDTFVSGFLSCLGILFASFFLKIQGESKSPLDGQKPRYRGVFGTMLTMVKTEGPRSLYSGLVAGLHRQMSFASVRIGLYDTMKQFYTRGSDSTSEVVAMW